VSVAIQGEGLITRVEDKYLVPEPSKDFLMRFLARTLVSADASAEAPETLIESVYFDSPNLELYRDHFASNETRYKLRTRRYGAGNFASSDAITVELKEKDHGLTRKTRLAIGDEQYRALVFGNAFLQANEISTLNPKLPRDVLRARVEQINARVSAFSLRPVCRIVYRRRAFEYGSLRVTCDEQLRFQALAPIDASIRGRIKASPFFHEAVAMGFRFLHKPSVVLEVKHRDEVPGWLSSFLREHQLESVKFSKYCFAITESLQ